METLALMMWTANHYSAHKTMSAPRLLALIMTRMVKKLMWTAVLPAQRNASSERSAIMIMIARVIFAIMLEGALMTKTGAIPLLHQTLHHQPLTQQIGIEILLTTMKTTAQMP